MCIPLLDFFLVAETCELSGYEHDEGESFSEEEIGHVSEVRLCPLPLSSKQPIEKPSPSFQLV